MREPVIAVSLQVLYLWLVSKKDFFIAQLVSNKWSCFFLSSSLVAAAAEGFPVLIYFFLQFLVACSSAAPPGRLYCGGFHLFVFSVRAKSCCLCAAFSICVTVSVLLAGPYSLCIQTDSTRACRYFVSAAGHNEPLPSIHYCKRTQQAASWMISRAC